MSSNSNSGKKEYYDGSGSTWTAIKEGAKQGFRDFVKDPVGPTKQASEDFNRAGNLTNRGRSGNGSGSGSAKDSSARRY